MESIFVYAAFLVGFLLGLIVAATGLDGVDKVPVELQMITHCKKIDDDLLHYSKTHFTCKAGATYNRDVLEKVL